MNTPSEATPSQLDVSQAALEAEEDTDELRPLNAIEKTYAADTRDGGLPRWGICLAYMAAGAAIAALALTATARRRPDLRQRGVDWAREHLPRRGNW